MKKYAFLRFPGFKDKALTLSYDDGVVYDRKLIEIMNTYGLKGTFNINSGKFPEKTGGRRLTKEECLNLYVQSGNEVAVHGSKHLSLTEVDETMGVNDILQDRITLENMFGKIIKGMAYANGVYDDLAVDILKKCGIEYARTIVSTESFSVPIDWMRMPTTCHHDNPRLMELAHIFVEKESSQVFGQNVPRLFLLWGHSYEFDRNDNWNIIEEFAKYMGNRKDIWYATNGEIYNYVKAYNRLEFSADGKIIYNPSSMTVWLKYFNQDIEIKPGDTIKIQI